MTTEDTASMPEPAQKAKATKAPRVKRPRRLWINILIGVATLLAIVSIFATWANRQIFNPNNWANTSTQLLQNPAVQTTAATFLVNQLYQNVDVEAALKNELPTALGPLAGPASGALRNVAQSAAKRALATPAIQQLWGNANRAAAAAFLAAVSGGSKHVQTSDGHIVLNLRPILASVAERIGLPASLAQQLPASAARVEIAHSSKLSDIQKICNAIRGLAVLLSILVPLLFLLALGLAKSWRVHALLVIGSAIGFAGLLVLLLRSIVISQLTNALASEPAGKDTVHAVVSIGTVMLGHISGAYVFVGIVLIIAALLAGPSTLARRGRGFVAPFLHEFPERAFAITVGVMVLVFVWQPIEATGKPLGMLVFLVLALLGTEALRRQTEVEFPAGAPAVGSGDTTLLA